MRLPLVFIFFFFNDTATTEIYTLSLHDALPISGLGLGRRLPAQRAHGRLGKGHTLPVIGARGGAIVHAAQGAVGRLAQFGTSAARAAAGRERSEEHTSELQSQSNLVCRLLLEKKK